LLELQLQKCIAPSPALLLPLVEAVPALSERGTKMKNKNNNKEAIKQSSNIQLTSFFYSRDVVHFFFQLRRKKKPNLKKPQKSLKKPEYPVSQNLAIMHRTTLLVALGEMKVGQKRVLAATVSQSKPVD
jgi:hypothetical protein